MIKVLYTNAQSVIKKIVIVLIKRPEIVALTETWTQGDIDNSSLKLDGYEIIDRRDRTDTAARRGGGIVLYAKSEINACKKDILTNFTQCACLTIKGTQRLAHKMANKNVEECWFLIRDAMAKVVEFACKVVEVVHAVVQTSHLPLPNPFVGVELVGTFSA